MKFQLVEAFWMSMLAYFNREIAYWATWIAWVDDSLTWFSIWITDGDLEQELKCPGDEEDPTGTLPEGSSYKLLKTFIGKLPEGGRKRAATHEAAHAARKGKKELTLSEKRAITHGNRKWTLSEKREAAAEAEEQRKATEDARAAKKAEKAETRAEEMRTAAEAAHAAIKEKRG
jgi:hypothetical protein